MIAQTSGSVIITAATFAAGFILMYSLKAIGILRISEGEIEGIDCPRRAPAYHPEYAYMGYSPIPTVMEGVAPGISSTSTAPPSDLHLPTSE